MKKLFVLAFVLSLSGGLFAQTTTNKNDLKGDVKDLKKDRKELRKDIKNHDKDAAKLERQDIKNDRKDIHQDAKDLGIKHPIRRIRHHRRHH